MQSSPGGTARRPPRGMPDRKPMISDMQSDAGLATVMRISVSRLARRLRVERLGLGGTETVLSDIQLAALAALERHDSMTPGELAEHEKVQPPSMTRVIAVLEERGLVRREPHPTDRRQVMLSVTADGRELVQRVRRRREAWLAQRLQELSPAEREILREAAPILEKISQS
jgi:DNA-binding MarR family transcriptional regulator